MKKTVSTLALLATLIALPASAQVNVDVGIDVDGGVSTSALNASVNATGSASLRERGPLQTNATGAEIRSFADVSTREDLNAFEENLVVINNRVTDADSSNARVAVSYLHDGKVLGVFPVQVESRTSIEIGEEDTVTLTTEMPWWSVFVTGLGGIREEVEAELLSNGQFSADILASEDARARARALEAIAGAHAHVAANN